MSEYERKEKKTPMKMKHFKRCFSQSKECYDICFEFYCFIVNVKMYIYMLKNVVVIVETVHE